MQSLTLNASTSTIVGLIMLFGWFSACSSANQGSGRTEFALGWFEALEEPRDDRRAFRLRIHIDELERMRKQPANAEEHVVVQETDYYYANQLGRDLYLVDGADSVRPVVCHVEQDGGLRPWRSVLVEFDVERSFGSHLTLHSPVTQGQPVAVVLTETH